MRIAVFASAALVLAATIGSASATDQSTPRNVIQKFATLKGVKAVPMSADELSAVKGMDHHFFVTTRTGVQVRHDTDQQQDANDGANFVEILRADGTIRLAAPSYRGLILHACANAVISGPSSAWC